MKPMELHYDERLRELCQAVVDTKTGLPINTIILSEMLMVIHILEELRDKGQYKLGSPSFKGIQTAK